MIKRSVEVNYHCGPITQMFHSDLDARAKLLLGPRGTGKTTAAAVDTIMLQSGRVKPDKNKLRRSRFLVVRNILDEIRTTTIPSYLEWFPEDPYGKLYSTHDYEMAFDDRRIEIFFRGLDKPGVEKHLLSMELTGAHVEEAREIRPNIIRGIMSCVGRYPSRKDYDGEWPFLSEPQTVLTSNYPNTKSWLARNFDHSPMDRCRVFKAGQDENRSNLPPRYYEDLAETYKDSPYELATLVRGEYGIEVTGHPVYPNFSRDRHVSKDKLLPIDAQVIRGWDNTGLSPACVITQLGPTGQWLILREFTGFDVGITDFGELVTVWCNQTFGSRAKYRDIGDPAGNTRDSNKMSPAHYLALLGIHIEDGIQTFKIRRETIDARLTKLINGQPAILIDPECDWLIDGFEGKYHHKEIGNSGVYLPEPEKDDYSHVHDALQYPATRLFLTQTQQQPKPVIVPKPIFVG